MDNAPGVDPKVVISVPGLSAPKSWNILDLLKAIYNVIVNGAIIDAVGPVIKLINEADQDLIDLSNGKTVEVDFTYNKLQVKSFVQLKV